MPSLSNIVVEPTARVEKPSSEGGDAIKVRVDGLMCASICARRVQHALEQLPGVASVSFAPESDTFLVQTRDEVSSEDIRQAVIGRVVLRSARRIIARLAPRVMRRTAR